MNQRVYQGVDITCVIAKILSVHDLLFVINVACLKLTNKRVVSCHKFYFICIEHHGLKVPQLYQNITVFYHYMVDNKATAVTVFQIITPPPDTPNYSVIDKFTILVFD